MCGRITSLESAIVLIAPIWELTAQALFIRG
jgi:hypothetical protein